MELSTAAYFMGVGCATWIVGGVLAYAAYKLFF